MCFWPPGLLLLPPASSAGPGQQEEHQQGQHRVPTATREEQHRCEEEPGQGPQEDPADPAEGPAAAGGKPEAADEDRAADTGAGHSQTHPVTAAPARSRGGSSRRVQHLDSSLSCIKGAMCKSFSLKQSKTNQNYQQYVKKKRF